MLSRRKGFSIGKVRGAFPEAVTAEAGRIGERGPRMTGRGSMEQGWAEGRARLGVGSGDDKAVIRST